MKYGRLLTAITASLMATRAPAIEAPADDAPPPARSLTREDRVEAPPAPRANAPQATAPQAAAPQANPSAQSSSPQIRSTKGGSAFLGVVSEAVPETYAYHLGIEKAIVVKGLMPDGPAAQAGIVTNDIITHIGNQTIQSPDELTRKVASHQPGEKLSVAIIRKGQHHNLNVTLGQRPNDFAEATPPTPKAQTELDALPKELVDRVREQLGENLGQRELNFNGLFPEMNDAVKQMRQHMENAMRNLEAPKITRERGIHLEQGATIRLTDQEGCVEINSNNGNKQVTVRDPNQNVVWSGPWDSAQDKAAAPDAVRKRIEALNIDSGVSGNSFKFSFGGSSNGR